MKLQIELTSEQLRLIINALEVTFRQMMWQQGSIVADLMMPDIPSKDGLTDDAWRTCFDQYLATRECAGEIYDALSKIMYGGSGTRVPEDCHRYSDMWSALRHTQWEMQKEKTDWDVRSGEPFRLSDYPMIKIDIIEEGENNG